MADTEFSSWFWAAGNFFKIFFDFTKIRLTASAKMPILYYISETHTANHPPRRFRVSGDLEMARLTIIEIDQTIEDCNLQDWVAPNEFLADLVAEAKQSEKSTATRNDDDGCPVTATIHND